jgi:Immunoglobulin-like domain of bacterial spore germination
MVHTHQPGLHTSQGGNAVTLTLLGLAVAILAGVAVLYWIGRTAPEQVPPQTIAEESTSTPQTMSDPRAGWQTYTDPLYMFSIQFPPGWVVATGTVGIDPVITVAPGVLNGTSTSTYHDSLTRVSVYPQGLSKGGVFESEQQSGVIIEVPQASAKDYVLESKRPWATVGKFDIRPSSWSEAGYIFARVAVEGESFKYIRGDMEITEEEFDPAADDRAVRVGYVDPAIRSTEEEILKSFQFVQEDVGLQQPVHDMILVESPVPESFITSPVTVAGKARGGWYFEGTFPVRLETEAGVVLAEVPATAQGEWTTTEFVPFELSVVFAHATATKGVLVLEKSNPSGLPELGDELRIPVSFAK